MFHGKYFKNAFKVKDNYNYNKKNGDGDNLYNMEEII